MISANTRNRIHAISIEGNVAERYFAVTSETPRKTVDARISAIPLNGRSVRAGARRAAGFRSSAGSGSPARPAGAAGGRGTSKNPPDSQPGAPIKTIFESRRTNPEKVRQHD